MKMTKLFSVLFLSLCFSSAIFAQNVPQKASEEKGFDKSRLFFGGSFGLSFGDYTIVNVSPQLGYRFSQYFAGGVGINGQYYSVKYYASPSNYREQYGIAGLNIFGRVYPIPQLFAQLQPELNYTWGKVKYEDGYVGTIDSKVRPALLAGAGGVIPAGNAGIVLMVQYDLLGESGVPPYGNKPFFNFGVNFGF